MLISGITITVNLFAVLLNPDLTVTCVGIRALPSFPKQSFASFTNLAVLRYVGALLQDPTNDPTTDIPTSQLPLKETDLHVGYTLIFSNYCANILNV
jgi:hypothetical protein